MDQTNTPALYLAEIAGRTLAQPHVVAPDRTGTGITDSARMRCTCGWAGPQRFEWQDDMSLGLAADKAAHLNGGRL